MSPLRLPSATVHFSEIGPLTLPPAIVVSSTVSGSFAPLLWLSAEFHADAGDRQLRAGSSCRSSPCTRRAATSCEGTRRRRPPDCALHCSTGGRSPPGNTVPSYGYSHFIAESTVPPACSALTRVPPSDPGQSSTVTLLASTPDDPELLPPELPPSPAPEELEEEEPEEPDEEEASSLDDDDPPDDVEPEPEDDVDRAAPAVWARARTERAPVRVADLVAAAPSRPRTRHRLPGMHAGVADASGVELVVPPPHIAVSARSAPAATARKVATAFPMLESVSGPRPWSISARRLIRWRRSPA